MAKRQSIAERGIKINAAAPEAAGPVGEYFGHITLVGGYALTVFKVGVRSRNTHES